MLRETLGALGDLELLLRDQFGNILAWLSSPVGRLLFIAVGLGLITWGVVYPPKTEYFRKRQRQKFIAHLQDKSVVGEVYVRGVRDQEALAIAKEIHDMLNDAGAQSVYQATMGVSVPFGVSIEIHDKKTRPKEVAALQQAFANAGLTVQIRYTSTGPTYIEGSLLSVPAPLNAGEEPRITKMPELVTDHIVLEIGYRP